MRILLVLFACIFSHNLLPAQTTTGAKVSFTAVDGKLYTGTVTDIQGNKSKVKYDNFDFEAWLDNATLTITNNNYQQQQVKATTEGDWQVGDKVDVRDMYTTMCGRLQQ
jgi:hypothetical protein